MCLTACSQACPNSSDTLYDKWATDALLQQGHGRCEFSLHIVHKSLLGYLFHIVQVHSRNCFGTCRELRKLTMHFWHPWLKFLLFKIPSWPLALQRGANCRYALGDDITYFARHVMATTLQGRSFQMEVASGKKLL